MFWNLDDSQLEKVANTPEMLEAYAGRSYPQIGWDTQPRINHFDLMHAIFDDYAENRALLAKFTDVGRVDVCGKVIEEEFATLMSPIRRHAIRKCLSKRHERFCAALV